MKLFTIGFLTFSILIFNVTNTRSTTGNSFSTDELICLIESKKEPQKPELTREQIDSINFLNFMHLMALKESSCRPTVINKYGYLGLYQMGGLALKDVGYNYQFFKSNLSDVEMQNQAFIKLCRTNSKRLDKHIKKYSGKYINGVKVSASGIISAAHLLGSKSVKNFLDGKAGMTQDANGTHVLDYMKFFQELNVDYVMC